MRKLHTASSIEHTARSRLPQSSQTADTIVATEDTVKVKL